MKTKTGNFLLSALVGLLGLLLVVHYCYAAVGISNAAALAACDAVVDLVDGGSGAGKLRILSGSAPADTDTAESGTLLAELTMSDPAFGACADATPGGTATANSITSDSSADATGTAGYYRIVDSDSNAIIQGTITATSGGGDIELDDISIESGDTVSISSLTFTMPES